MSHVRDVLKNKNANVATLEQSASVLDAARLMSERGIGSVVVMEGSRIAGIFTERDLLNRVVAVGKNPSATSLKDVMTARVAFCTCEDSLDSCRSAMTRNRMRHLPVVEDGKLIGIISSGDILARELQDQEWTLKYLHDYMTGPN